MRVNERVKVKRFSAALWRRVVNNERSVCM